MTIENATSTTEVQVQPTEEVQQTQTSQVEETSEGMSTVDISKLSDEELNQKLDGEPPAPKVETPKGDSEIEKYKKQVAEKELAFQRQATELGQLRKQIQSQQAPPPPAPEQGKQSVESQMSADELTALMLEDPRKAMQVLDNERQQVEAKRQAEMAERTRNLKVLAPDLETNAEMIAKIMKEQDGLTDDQIMHIANNIDKVPQDIIFNYNQRAKQAKEIEGYKAKIAELEGKPARLLGKIEAAQKPHMTSSSGQSNPPGKTSSKKPEEMNDSEFNEALAKSGIK
jgi:hypothetical protein